MLIKSYSRLVTLSFALSVELVISSILPAMAMSPYTEQQQLAFSSAEIIAQRSNRRSRLRFKVPGIRPSRNLQGGAARGNCGVVGAKAVQMRALLPNTKIGLTTTGNPTFFFQISPTSVEEAKFILLNAKGDTIIYEKTFSLNKTGGVLSFTLPADADALEVGEEYTWELAVLCDPDDQVGNPRVQGSIKRIEPSSMFTRELANAPMRDRVVLYAEGDQNSEVEGGYWYDAIKTLADLRLANPNDPTLISDWKELLDSAGLSAVDQELLLPCCTSSPSGR
ncbi:MAG: DUF928 domain-containing protein [Cyanobacteriota bacterium]